MGRFGELRTRRHKNLAMLLTLVSRGNKSKYGTFYDGDSFIILHTIKDKESRKLRHDVFMWLGMNSTQDELGVAAYKMVELDDLLGGEPTQHRVIQDHEPRKFMRLFKKPIVVLSGGVEGGFNKVKAKSYKPRLLWVKGKAKNLRVKQCEPRTSNMNHGDVFIMDAGLVLFQWNGKESGPFERNKASEVISGIKADRLNSAGVSNVDLQVIEDGDENARDFWEVLQGDASNVRNATDVEETDTMIRERKNALFRISDASGNLKVTPEGEGALSLSMLDSNDVFVVDAKTEIFVWVGKNASKKERRKAMPMVNKFMHQKGLDIFTPVTRVVEGAREPAAFRNAFSGGGGAEGAEGTEFQEETKKCCLVM